jgi:hypothetical protein
MGSQEIQWLLRKSGAIPMVGRGSGRARVGGTWYVDSEYNTFNYQLINLKPSRLTLCSLLNSAIPMVRL